LYGVLPGNKIRKIDLDTVRELTLGNVVNRPFAAGATGMKPETVVFGPDSSPQKLVPGAPVPAHIGIIERRFCRRRIRVVEAKWHAYCETQPTVITCLGDSKYVIERLGGAVLAGAQPVFKVDKGDGIVLPRHFGREPDVVAAALGIDQLDVTHVEPEVCKCLIGTAALDRVPFPAGNERNIDGVVPLAAGSAKPSHGERGKCTRRQDQVAVLLTSAASSSLAESLPSSFSGASE